MYDLPTAGWYPEQPVPVSETVRHVAPVWVLEGDDAGVHGLYGVPGGSELLSGPLRGDRWSC